MARYGYVRVSTMEQDYKRQLFDLMEQGVTERNIFADKMSGGKKDRPGLQALLDKVQDGDVIYVSSVDRIGRNTIHLLELGDFLAKKGVGLISLKEKEIDTTTPAGKLFFSFCSFFAQYEKDLIRERTKNGLKATRARGRLGGRPKLDPNNPKIQLARMLYNENNLCNKEICRTLEISESTFYYWLRVTRKD